MAKAWHVPTGDDLWQIVTRPIAEKNDEDSAGGTVDGNDIDESLDTRASKAVEHAVAEVRAAIEVGGRHPLSLTAGSVPPEGERHVLVMAAWWVCAMKPSLLAVLFGDGGAYSPMGALYKEAREWLKGLEKGEAITYPLDPTGEDYESAVSADNPLPNGVMWGDMYGSAADYEQGFSTDPDTGQEMPLPLNFKT